MTFGDHGGQNIDFGPFVNILKFNLHKITFNLSYQ